METSKQSLINIAPFADVTFSSRSSLWSTSDDEREIVTAEHDKKFSFHTELEDAPWILVDLKRTYCISYIKVFNRSDMCKDRAKTLRIEYSDDKANYNILLDINEDWGNVIGIPVENIETRYLKFSLKERNYLHLKKIEIYTSETEVNVDQEGRSLISISPTTHSEYDDVPKKYILIGRDNEVAEAIQFLGELNVLCVCKENVKGGHTLFRNTKIPLIQINDLSSYYKDHLDIVTTEPNIFDRQLHEMGYTSLLLNDVINDILRQEAIQYETANKRETFRYSRSDEFLIWRDRYKQAGSFGSYSWQDLWAAKRIFTYRPDVHYDIGSRFDGFITHLLSFGQIVRMIDIRPLDIHILGLEFIQADATKLDTIRDNSIQSLSALCSLEHFGLGRYGDPIDPEACFNCFDAIQRKLVPGGYAYISVPIGKEHLEWNAHRIFNPYTVVNAFNECDLVEFSSCRGKQYEEYIELDKYSEEVGTRGGRFGLFRFRKNKYPYLKE